MTDSPEKRTHFTPIQLLPNMVTIVAICAGLSAIRFGVQGDFVIAVKLIILACVLDGLDGLLARLLSSDSKIGAELDSLADFLNFGVAPPLIIYFWALQDMSRAGWVAVLVFAVCCVVRLARFNVNSKAVDEHSPCPKNAYFTGVPSTAGAPLVLLPMFVSFAFVDTPQMPDLFICIYMILVGLAMISRIPTLSLKSMRISPDNVKFFLVGFAIFGAAALTYAWITMVVLCFGYIGTIFWCLLVKPTPKMSKEN
ncbi:MAG: phosphatidylcholine/phosphatidylserine synthase [Roseobacter sp.]